ncbi:S24 family peptidase [Flavobacterium sp. JP2137]|uniref:S24 family peptidase n=1 Tax=Flavobacterium sp. JP2137 TaxID=3414510 RepID=UPI003D2FD6EC
MIKKRIVQLVEIKGLKKELFYKKIGMTSASFRGKARETPINSTALENILSEIPDINLHWLLTGKGSALREIPKIASLPPPCSTADLILTNQEVPLYALEAATGLRALFDSGDSRRVIDTIKIPNLPKCDGAITVKGDSMYPLLQSGDTILYRQTQVDYIFFGELYLLSITVDKGEEYITVKYVQRSLLGEDYVSLVAQNPQHQSKDIKKGDIAAIALVKASIRISSMQ